MCESHVYISKNNNEEELFLESVDQIIPEDENKWRLVSIFGEQKILNGKIKEMNLVNHRIIFEELE